MSPVRTCAVCRQRRSDALMTRAGRAPSGVWYLGRGSGRGLWWCSQGECVARLHVGLAQKALRVPFSAAEVADWEQFAQGLKMAVVVEE